MSASVLDTAYRVEQTGGVARYRAVVAGEQPEGCKYPAAAQARDVIGVTLHDQTREGKSVAVRRLGIAPCEAAGIISRGDRVVVADNTGRIRRAVPVKAQVGAANTEGGVRFDIIGDPPAALNRVVYSAEGVSQTLGASLAGGELRIQLQTNAEEDATSTAAQVATYINSTAPLNQVIRATHGGSAGSAVPSVSEADFTGYDLAANPIGVAQQDSTGEGDIIDILLL